MTFEGRLTEEQRRLVEENIELVRITIGMAINGKLIYRNRQGYWLKKDQVNDDTVQMGYIGLCTAAMNYNYDKNVSFSSFAIPCIMNTIYTYMRMSYIRERGFGYFTINDVAKNKSTDEEFCIWDHISAANDVEKTALFRYAFSKLILTYKEKLLVHMVMSGLSETEIYKQLKRRGIRYRPLVMSIRKKWLEVAADGKGDKSEPKEACEIKMKWEILRKNSQGRQFFAERLNDLLSEKGINCGRLAGVLGADPSMFSRYKEGVCFPSFKTMCDIMDYFKCSIDSFFPVDQKLLESQNKERPRNSRQRCHDYIKGAVDEKNILSDSKMKSASRFLLNSQDDTENTVSEVESLSRVDKQVSVWGKAKELIALIQEICPDSKEKTISISKMEEAIMWASNAISRQE